MTTYVALLYSIILLEGRRLVMADLRAMAERLGLHASRTLVATGNLIFEAEETTVAQLEARLERAFEETFGRHVDIIVRSAADWKRLVAGNPFPVQSEADGSRVAVRVMREPAPIGTLQMLERYATNGESLMIVDGDLWMAFPSNPGASKVVSALTPRRLGIGTSRNWNTIRRLGEMLDR